MSRIPISSLLNPVDDPLDDHEPTSPHTSTVVARNDTHTSTVARNDTTTTTLPRIAPHPQPTGQGYASQPAFKRSSTNGSSTPDSASQKPKNPYSCPLKACGRTFNTSAKLSSHYHREHIPSLREELIAERLKREAQYYGSDRA